MSQTRRFDLVTVTALAAFTLATAVSGCGSQPPSSESAAEPTAASAPDPAMQLHHLHGLMAHGFEMALQGASLKMLGQMNMTAAVDAVAASHGEAMVTDGKALIDQAINGPAMTALHPPAGGSDTLMTYTHDLGTAMTGVIDRFQRMPPVAPKDPKDMELHHMHLALAHAAVMASQAASLKMTAAMKMAGPADEAATTHAGAMLAHARNLYDETMKGGAMVEAMKGAPAGAVTGQGMTSTHELGDSLNAVIELLSKMP